MWGRGERNDPPGEGRKLGEEEGEMDTCPENQIFIFHYVLLKIILCFNKLYFSVKAYGIIMKDIKQEKCGVCFYTYKLQYLHASNVFMSPEHKQPTARHQRIVLQQRETRIGIY